MKLTSAVKNKLDKLNLIAGMVHLLGASIILGWARDGADWPITTSFLRFDQFAGSSQWASQEIGSINIALLVALFFLVSASFHFAVRTVWNKKYFTDISAGLNRFRWLEYSISIPIMMLVIAMVSGIYDQSSLIMIFSLSAIANLMGLVMDLWNRDRLELDKPIRWIPYAIGYFASIVPWLIFIIYVVGSDKYGGGTTSSSIYWIYVTIFLFFNCFAANAYLQYKKVGKWSNYLYGEKIYILLSLIAKVALAGQVFAAVLKP